MINSFFRRGNTKGNFFLICYRISSFFTKNKVFKFVGFPVRVMYRLTIQWIMGIDIPDTTVIGRGFNLYHGQGVVISSKTIIGENVTIRQNTTIGNAHSNGGCPTLGNNVQIGANSVIIGQISIGDNAVIAAGSVVIKNVRPYTLVAGNPAIEIKVYKELNVD